MDKANFIKQELNGMEISFWKSIVLKSVKPKEMKKYEEKLEEEKSKLMNILSSL